jgi:hypothetical protein
VRVLGALKIIEAATIDCKTHNIDTPEVREALDLLASYCWKLPASRSLEVWRRGLAPAVKASNRHCGLT